MVRSLPLHPVAARCESFSRKRCGLPSKAVTRTSFKEETVVSPESDLTGIHFLILFVQAPVTESKPIQPIFVTVLRTADDVLSNHSITLI